MEKAIPIGPGASVHGKSGSSRRYLNKFSSVLALLIVSGVVAAAAPGAFLTVSNFTNVVKQMSTNGILAIGMTMVMVSGGIDLSVGSVLAVSGTLSCGLISSGVHAAYAVAVGMLVGPAFGVFNGFFVARMRIPPFIVTLASMQIARGVSYIYSNGLPIRSKDPLFNNIGNGALDLGGLRLPIPIMLLAGIVVVSYLLLQRARFGWHVYAVGGNVEAARYSGINVERTLFLCYIYSACLSAFVGIVLASRMYSGQPTMGIGFEMDAVAAAVLGGTSFSGGAGTIVGTLIGALTIGVINNGLNLLDVPFYYQSIVKGCVILGAVLLDKVRDEKK